LGIAYQIQSSVVRVTNKNAQQLMPGDIVKNVRLEMKSFKNDAEADWITKKQIEEGQWAFVSHRILHGQSVITKMTYKVERKVDGKPETVEVEIPITIDKSWPMADRGWLLSSDTRVVKADNSWQAIELGFSDTHNRMLEVFYTLRGIILRDISPDVIGGPLTIAKGAYIFAGLNFGEFIFFIGLISINLAVVNFLPIPVLDGGHMVFLIYEKLRGQPASEAIRIWATYAGLAVILCLMLFVLYLDVNRLFF
jgi:regulator of sigma E protease